MIRPFRFLAVLLFLVSSLAAAPLPRSTPEAQGIASADVRAFVEAANEKIDTMHSFMLVRHGKVIAEGWWKPESPDKPHVLYSLSKSFTSTAVGLAIAEGKLSLDDPVIKFFPEYVPEKPSDKLKSMRVRDLLTMSTGHDSEPRFTSDVPWPKTFLAHPVPHKPGAHFQYNSPATYMCSAIVQKTTGQPILEYLKPRLFEPLGIEGATWDNDPQGINVGGWGLKVRTEDIAKFGQLYLQKGKWGDKQLIPAAWIEMATSKQVSNGSDPTRDWDQGYGFQFWRCRHSAFRGDGAFGQFCLVMPEQDAVLAITANCRDMQAQLNIVWDKLLPAFKAEALADNAAEQAKLKDKLATLAVPADHKELTLTLPGVSGKVVEGAIKSEILKKEMKYAVYLPPGYESSQQTYPVLYLLHGLGGTRDAWVKGLDIRNVADGMLRAGTAGATIIVMPDAESTFYLNHIRGEYNYEDYFFKELLPQVEKSYRCRAEKKSRSIAGMSMGGYGALLYSIKHPELFQSCYAMAPAVRTDDEIRRMPHADFVRRYKTALGEIKEGDERITDFWRKSSILDLVKQMPEEQKKAVRFFIDCGDDDYLYTGNATLHMLMRDLKIPHEYRTRDGGHSQEYWKGCLPEALTFVGAGSPRP